jgi:ankyrin repeat protein
MAKLLIESGADVNARMLGSLDWTPVGEAARFGLVNTLNRLLDHGASINSRTRNGATPLHLAVDYKNFQAAETLVNRGADVNALTEEGVTPLQLFANGSRDERGAEWSGGQAAALLKLLLAKGADVNAKNRGGATALHYAVLQNNLRTARILTDNGANANAMELPDRQYYGRELHHEGSEMTLQQRIRDTLESSWWKQGLPRLSNNLNSGVAD